MTNKDALLANTGKNLKKLIKESGMTQEKFATDVMFVCPTTLRKWLYNGITKTEILIDIATFFDVSFEELFK